MVSESSHLHRPVTASRHGHVFANPLTKERAVVLTDPATHPHRVLVGHLYVDVGGRVGSPHLHPSSTERFHVLAGRVSFQIGDDRHVLGPGERAEVKPGVLHDWWQVGESPAEVLVEMAPGDRFTELIATMFGLTRDGRVTRNGMPDLLQLAVTGHAYRDTLVFASPPPWLQRVLFGALSPVGRLLGRRPTYPRYQTSSEIVPTGARVLGELAADGRLRWSEPPR